MTAPTREQALAHFGVKGMHWGQRKGPSRTQQIKIARATHNNRIAELNRLTAKADSAESLKRRKELLDKIHKVAKEGLESGDVSLGSKMTRGEKVTSVILTGGIATLVVGAAMKQQGQQATRVLKDFGNLKISDFD